MNRGAAATKRVHRWHSLVTFALASKKQEAATAPGVPVKSEYCEYLRSNREFMNSARTRLLVYQNRGSWRAASRIDSRTATVYSEFLRKHLATSRDASRLRNWKKKSPEAFTACSSIVDVVRSVKYRGSFATRVHHRANSSRHLSVVCKSTSRAHQTFLAIQLTPVSSLDFRCCSADHGIQSPNRCMRQRCTRKKGLYYRFNEVCANGFARQKLRHRVLRHWRRPLHIITESSFRSLILNLRGDLVKVLPKGFAESVRAFSRIKLNIYDVEKENIWFGNFDYFSWNKMIICKINWFHVVLWKEFWILTYKLKRWEMTCKSVDMKYLWYSWNPLIWRALLSRLDIASCVWQCTLLKDVYIQNNGKKISHSHVYLPLVYLEHFSLCALSFGTKAYEKPVIKTKRL